MVNYEEETKSLLKDTNISAKGTNIDALILDARAEKSAEENTDKLFDHMHTALHDEVLRILKPRFEFVNVAESGIMICGKEGNIATGKSTFYELFRAFFEKCGPEQFEELTLDAGRRSALHFANDFEKMLISGDKTELPFSEESFMQLYSEFDSRSAWWDGPIEYAEESSGERSYIGAVIHKPFTSYPWLSRDISSHNRFLEGYIQTLFNYCADRLRVACWTNGYRTENRKFALSLECFDEPDRENEYIHINYTNQYVREWLRIDQIIYWINTKLISLDHDHDHDIWELIDALKALWGTLSERLTPDAKERISFDEEIGKVKNNFRDIKGSKFRLQLLMHEIKLAYEDFRIEFLSKK